MTLLRRFGCVEIWFALAVFVIGTAISSSVGDKRPTLRLRRRRSE